VTVYGRLSLAKRPKKFKSFTRERLHQLLNKLSYIYIVLGAGLMLVAGAIIYISELQKDGTLPQFQKKHTSWSYFHPRWKKQSFWNLLTSTPDEAQEKLSKSFTEIHKIINDPDNRVDNRFSVPAPLVNRVLFWIDVYARYDSRIRIVHDRNDVGIIYGYIDFRPLYRKYRRRPVLAYKNSRRIERQIIYRLKSLLDSARYEQGQSPYLPDESAALRGYLKSLGLFSRINILRDTIRTQTGQRDKFQIGLLRSQKLMPHIESVFKDYHLPLPLARIPFVESSFNPRAQSRLGATGLWQIMPATAREYIHRSDRKKWRDPILQTKAAARLLRDYRKSLPDWGTTVTAYNSGVGRLKRLLRENRAKNYIQLYTRLGDEGLGFAGRNFYSELLAATLVEAYKEEIFSLVLSPSQVTKIYKKIAPFDEELCQVK